MRSAIGGTSANETISSRPAQPRTAFSTLSINVGLVYKIDGRSAHCRSRLALMEPRQESRRFVSKNRRRGVVGNLVVTVASYPRESLPATMKPARSSGNQHGRRLRPSFHGGAAARKDRCDRSPPSGDHVIRFGISIGRSTRHRHGAWRNTRSPRPRRTRADNLETRHAWQTGGARNVGHGFPYEFCHQPEFCGAPGILCRVQSLSIAPAKQSLHTLLISIGPEPGKMNCITSTSRRHVCLRSSRQPFLSAARSNGRPQAVTHSARWLPLQPLRAHQRADPAGLNLTWRASPDQGHRSEDRACDRLRSQTDIRLASFLQIRHGRPGQRGFLPVA